MRHRPLPYIHAILILPVLLNALHTNKTDGEVMYLDTSDVYCHIQHPYAAYSIVNTTARQPYKASMSTTLCVIIGWQRGPFAHLQQQHSAASLLVLKAVHEFL